MWINEGINSERTTYCPVVKIYVLQHSELLNIQTRDMVFIKYEYLSSMMIYQLWWWLLSQYI